MICTRGRVSQSVSVGDDVRLGVDRYAGRAGRAGREDPLPFEDQPSWDRVPRAAGIRECYSDRHEFRGERHCRGDRPFRTDPL